MFSLSMFRVFAPAFVVIVLVMALGPASAPAEAAVGRMSVSLRIVTSNEEYSQAQVSGLVRMTRAEAQSYIDRRAKVCWRLYGDDPASDDLVYGPNCAATLTATDTGLEFRGRNIVLNYLLDEDWGRDEVYASVALVDTANGNATVRAAESDRIQRSF